MFIANLANHRYEGNRNALLTVKDVLESSGELKHEISLRAEITKGKKSRLVYFTHKELREKLTRYIEYRNEKKLGIGGNSLYCGLDPTSRLYCISKTGDGFGLSTKYRINEGGESVVYYACDALEALFRKMYRQVGIKTSSHSGRRTFATILVLKGHAVKTVSTLLGHSSINHTQDYIEVSKSRLLEMAEQAI